MKENVYYYYDEYGNIYYPYDREGKKIKAILFTSDGNKIPVEISDDEFKDFQLLSINKEDVESQKYQEGGMVENFTDLSSVELHIAKSIELASKFKDDELLWVAFFHDIGKGVTKVKKEDRVLYPKHEFASAEILSGLKDDIRLSRSTFRAVYNAVKEHMKYKYVWQMKLSTLLKVYLKYRNYLELFNKFFIVDYFAHINPDFFERYREEDQPIVFARMFAMDEIWKTIPDEEKKGKGEKIVQHLASYIKTNYDFEEYVERNKEKAYRLWYEYKEIIFSEENEKEFYNANSQRLDDNFFQIHLSPKELAQIRTFEKKVLSQFPYLKEHLYLIGGASRDFIARVVNKNFKEVNDFDFIIESKEIFDRFLNDLEATKGSNDLSLVKAGIEFLHFKIVVDGYEFEFGTPRKEAYFDESRRPIVKLGSILDDIHRRDFTINAIPFQIESIKGDKLYGRIHEKGMQGFYDMERGLLLSFQEPYQMFYDDPLRILRLIRFSQYYGLDLDMSYVRSAFSIPDEVIRKKVSRERVSEEVLKIMRAGLNVFKYGLIYKFFPQIKDIHFVDKYEEGGEVMTNELNRELINKLDKFKDFTLPDLSAIDIYLEKKELNTSDDNGREVLHAVPFYNLLQKLTANFKNNQVILTFNEERKRMIVNKLNEIFEIYENEVMKNMSNLFSSTEIEGANSLDEIKELLLGKIEEEKKSVLEEYVEKVKEFNSQVKATAKEIDMKKEKEAETIKKAIKEGGKIVKKEEVEKEKDVEELQEIEENQKEAFNSMITILIDSLKNPDFEKIAIKTFAKLTEENKKRFANKVKKILGKKAKSIKSEVVKHILLYAD